MIFFFLKNLGTPGVRMQKYPKSTSTQKVSGMGRAPFLEYPCFIGCNVSLTQVCDTQDLWICMWIWNVNVSRGCVLSPTLGV